jgi:hypothetical protein
MSSLGPAGIRTSFSALQQQIYEAGRASQQRSGLGQGGLEPVGDCIFQHTAAERSTGRTQQGVHAYAGKAMPFNLRSINFCRIEVLLSHVKEPSSSAAPPIMPSCACWHIQPQLPTLVQLPCCCLALLLLRTSYGVCTDWLSLINNRLKVLSTACKFCYTSNDAFWTLHPSSDCCVHSTSAPLVPQHNGVVCQQALLQVVLILLQHKRGRGSSMHA